MGASASPGTYALSVGGGVAVQSLDKMIIRRSLELAEGSTRTFSAVPAGQQEAGDLHLLGVMAAPAGAGVDDTRGVTSVFKDAADRTLTLGPVLGPVTVTTVGDAPYLRLRTQYTVQSQYDGAWVLGLGPDLGNSVSFVVTAGYMDGSSTLDQTVPDFSGVTGWQNSWGMASGVTTNWFLSATGWTSQGGVVISPYEEGGMIYSATGFGTIMP